MYLKFFIIFQISLIIFPYIFWKIFINCLTIFLDILKHVYANLKGKFILNFYKQLPIILNVLGRTSDIQYGSGRFDPKTGFVGSRKKTSLTKNQETCEQKGICTPRLIPGNGKQGRISPIQE